MNIKGWLLAVDKLLLTMFLMIANSADADETLLKINRCRVFTVVHITWVDPEGGQGVWIPHPENHKNIGFSRNIDPDPLKFTKLPSQHSMVGCYQHATETPFHWWADDGPLLVAVRSLSIPSTKNNKKNPKKHPCWTPSDKTFRICACIRLF